MKQAVLAMCWSTRTATPQMPCGEAPVLLNFQFLQNQRPLCTLILNTLSKRLFFSLSCLVWISTQELTRLYHTEHMLLFREISLASNQLTTLHVATHLCRVQTLDLDDNQLETLPEDMAKLPELRVLSLRRNSIPD